MSGEIFNCAICSAVVHVEYSKWMTRWIEGRERRICRKCDRTGAWKARGEERPPEEIAERRVIGQEPGAFGAAEEVQDQDDEARIEIGKVKDMAKDTITKKCKGCGEEFEAQDGRVRRCKKCLASPTRPSEWSAPKKRQAKSSDGDLGAVIEERMREIAGEVVNENSGGGIDEDLIERIVERLLKARLKALLG